MRKIDQLIATYGESHQNETNKAVHWICVPTIVFTLLGVLFALPFLVERTFWLNWASLSVAIILFYYLRLSLVMAISMTGIAFLMLFGINQIYQMTGQNATQLAWVMFGLFAAAWVGQFVGHKIEGKKPSFLEDVQYLLIGPVWLLHFIYKKLGINY
ncbi:MAG: hypothetical protein RL757_1527 [Bacteroidota bacterium]|jgi:uncharacterized membrane protein YGL010W